jgi:hypothetical protein
MDDQSDRPLTDSSMHTPLPGKSSEPSELSVDTLTPSESIKLQLTYFRYIYGFIMSLSFSFFLFFSLLLWSNVVTLNLISILFYQKERTRACKRLEVG